MTSLKELTLPELDSMGYWRMSLRRRLKSDIRSMTAEDRFRLSDAWNEGKKKLKHDRLRRRRPDITEMAIRDLVFNHLLRSSDREREIASRIRARERSNA